MLSQNCEKRLLVSSILSVCTHGTRLPLDDFHTKKKKSHDSHKPVPIRPRWREVAVPVLWPVPEAAVTVFSTPDDGCCDTWNM